MTRSQGAGIAHDAVVRQHYRQLAPRTADGGRKILYRCPCCSRLWLMNGRGASFALRTAEQYRFYARALEVEPFLAPLPQAICRPCGIEFGGLYSVEEYFQHDGPCSYSRGFRLSWEGVKSYPTDAYLSCSVLTLGEREGEACDWRDLLAQVELDVAISPLSCVEGVVAWLKRLSAPRAPLPFLTREEERRVGTPAPGEGRSGSSLLEWKGCSWFDWCPPLRGPVLVSMAVALPPWAQCPSGTLLDLWTKALPSCEGEVLALLLGLPQQGALV